MSITDITSTGGTVTVTDPLGPTTNLEVGTSLPLGRLSYHGASDTSYSISGTAMTAVDTMNLRLAVVIPADGSIILRWSAYAGVGNAAQNTYGGAMIGATVISTGLYQTANNNLSRVTYEDYITGLTPGAANIDLAGYTASGSDPLTLFHGPTFGPIFFAIFAA